MKLGPTILAAILLGFGSPSFALPYGNYDLHLLLKQGDPAKGISPSIDTAVFDHMLNDLALHARNYPPTFDSAQDRGRAMRDADFLLNICDTMVQNEGQNPNILRRAALLNSIGHNLDIKGCAPKANDFFLRLLALNASDPSGNFMYGVFLGGVGKGKESIPYLERALSLGVVDANYSLGIAYMMGGNKDRALSYLKAYKAAKPENPDTDKLIEGIEQGKFEVKHFD